MGPVPVNANHAGRSDCKLEGFGSSDVTSKRVKNISFCVGTC